MPYSHYSGFYGMQQSEAVDGLSVADNQARNVCSPSIAGSSQSFHSSWHANATPRQVSNAQVSTYVPSYRVQPVQHAQTALLSVSGSHQPTNTTCTYHSQHAQPSAYRLESAIPRHTHYRINATQTCTTPAHSPRAGDVLCFFGGPCMHLTAPMLTGKVSAIQKHLLEYHPAQLRQDSIGGVLSRCLWEDEAGRPCLKDVHGVPQLAKHIATVHLKILEVMCSECGCTFSRKDSLNRHKAGRRCVSGPE